MPGDIEPLDLFLDEVLRESPTTHEAAAEIVGALRALATLGETTTLPAIGVLALMETAFEAGCRHGELGALTR